jgi:hypothetical protein
VAAAAVSVWLRRGATAVAASRVGVGVVAFAAPMLVSRSWVGRPGDGTPGRVLGRALGGRDLALGVGTLIALQRQSDANAAAIWTSALASEPATAASGPGAGTGTTGAETGGTAEGEAPGAAISAATWVGLAAVADGLDLLITARSWDDLPAVKRWLVALSAGGAAAVGGVAAGSLLAGAFRQRRPDKTA